MITIEQCDESVFSTGRTDRGQFADKYPFRYMTSGQCFKVENCEKPNFVSRQIRSASTYYCAKHGGKFAIRVDGKTVFCYKTSGEKHIYKNNTDFQVFDFDELPQARQSSDPVRKGIIEALTSLEVGKSIKISFKSGDRFKSNEHLRIYISTCINKVVREKFNGEAVFKTKRIENDSKVAILRQR